MDKLKRYLGLAAAILLLLTAIPLPSASNLPTPFASVATLTTLHIHPQGHFWFDPSLRLRSPARFLQDMEDCRGRLDSATHHDCSDLASYSWEFVTRHRAEFFAYEPDMLGLLNRYHAAVWARANLGKEKWHHEKLVRNPPPSHLGSLIGNAEQRFREQVEAQSARIEKLELASARLEELEPRVVAAFSKYAGATKPGLATVIYAVHALLILLVVLMVRKRHRVGAAILWPFSALITAVKAGACAAKRLHEKV